ncbi:hypothetical protein Mapa_016888 [Marchantia paleacea]|nr:hypothetical protein Mapa_016888 [Marchantia paleacea]
MKGYYVVAPTGIDHCKAGRAYGRTACMPGNVPIRGMASHGPHWLSGTGLVKTNKRFRLTSMFVPSRLCAALCCQLSASYLPDFDSNALAYTLKQLRVLYPMEWMDLPEPDVIVLTETERSLFSYHGWA